MQISAGNYVIYKLTYEIMEDNHSCPGCSFTSDIFSRHSCLYNEGFYEVALFSMSLDHSDLCSSCTVKSIPLSCILALFVHKNQFHPTSF